jgi:uncharacterized protein (DUF433 family)
MPPTGPACFPHVVRDPGVLGGEPTIVGTRIPVWVVVAAWRTQQDLAHILRAYPALTPALVQEALAFAEMNAAEIEAALAANEVELA